MKWCGRRKAGATTLLAGALALGSLTAARATVDESRDCRATLGKELGKLNKTALKTIDACYKTQHKAGSSPASCNVVGSTEFDPDGKYADKKAAAGDKIAGKCLAGDPVLANYVGTPFTDVSAQIEEGTTGNSVLVLGNQNLGDPKANKADVKCIETIAKSRGGIFKEVLKDSTKCQTGLDDAATTFGAIDSSCIDQADKSGPKATDKITKACEEASADAGSCFPLPACAVDASKAAAQNVARAIYSTQPPPPPVCGNGTVESPEQCDDNNTTSGDGCSASCASEGPSCDAVAGSSVIGTRTVTVAVNTPQTLAGIQITLDYPQFQAGIPGTGQSSIVASAVNILQGNPADYLAVSNDRDTDLAFVIGSATDFITTGNLFTVTMEACVAKETNLCNRNQNIIGCCDAGGTGQNCPDFNAPVICPAGQFPSSTVGTGTPEDCCPADNACVTQASATTCTVSSAVDSNGSAVDGVTCSVIVSGT